MVWLCLLSLVTFCEAQKEIMKFNVFEEVAADTLVGDISNSHRIKASTILKGETRYST